MNAQRFAARAHWITRHLALILFALISTTYSLRAGEAIDGKTALSASTEEEPEYKNWIELGIGGLIINGDVAQFKQEHRMSGDLFGGIQDLHYEQAVGKKGQFSIDGHAIFDNHDYDVRVELSQPNVGFIRGGFTEYRSWYDGNGGFFPPNGGTWFRPFFPEMHIDRGEAWIEFGLRLPDWPEITLRWSRVFRDGQKDSTHWGDTNRTGGDNVLPGLTRKIIPSFRDIDETRDILSFEASKTFGNTDVLLGMRWEQIEDKDDLKMVRNVGQINPPPVSGRQRFVTQQLNDDIDLFSGHAITETRFTDNFWFTAGYSYTTLENDLSGSRIIGTHFDSAFGEPVPQLAQRDHAFLDLAGIAQVDYHVVNANLFWIPLPNLSIISGFRYTHEGQNNNDIFLAEEPVANVAPFTPPTGTNPDGGFHFEPGVPVMGEKISDYDRFAERIDLRYTGIKNWLFYVEGEWEEECGHVFENQQNVGQDEEVIVDKDTHFLGQKYVVGATWYPMTRLNLAAQFYHKIAAYDNDLFEATGQRLVSQEWDTDNANIRVTITPKIPACLGTLSLVSRYDFNYTTIDGKWALDTDPLAGEQTGKITRHTIAEAITWNPLARLYLQGNFSYVLNKTDTPANYNLTPNTMPTVLDFTSDYWTASGAAGFALDQKTDLHAEYSYYRADNYVNNALAGMPYGMGATEHTVSASVSRQIAKNVRLKVQYSYFNYTDQTSGGHNNYEAHAVYSSLQVRF